MILVTFLFQKNLINIKNNKIYCLESKSVGYYASD